jgi:response regulator NasT
VRILVVDPDPSRRERVVAVLRQAPDVRILLIENTLGVVEHVSQFAPDVVIVACEAPARDAIEDLRRVTETNPRPIVMFVDRSEPEHAEAALRAGVAAYVVDGIDTGRMRSILDIAMAQFRVTEELRQDLADARASLAARKTIEKAKGVLMKRRNVDEAAAYALLRKASMDQGKSIVEVAAQLLSAEAMLGGSGDGA